MIVTRLLKVLQPRWKLAALVGLVLVLFSLLLLTYAFLPVAEPVRWQATLAPTLLVPPGTLP